MLIPRLWQQGSCSGGSCKETRIAPMLDTAGSCPLQWTHHMAKLSPSVRMVAPLGKSIYEITRTLHIRERRKGWRKVKETTMRTLRERRRRKRCHRCWCRDFLIGCGENHARAETLQTLEGTLRSTALGKDPDWSSAKHEKEQQTERSCSGLTPNPLPLHQGWDDKVVNEGATMNLGRRRRRGRGRCIRFFFLLLTIHLYFSC